MTCGRLALGIALLSCLQDTVVARLLGTAYMDAAEQCNGQVTREDHVNQGDYYAVVSDIWQGDAPRSIRLLARCAQVFNFGDRAAVLHIQQWLCNRELEEPLLEIYDNCQADRVSLLMMLNCSWSGDNTAMIRSTSSCLSLFNSRGRTRKGYYFELRVVAGDEFIPFPLGGIAGIFSACVVTVLIVTKIICVATGYEKRLPNINYEFIDDQKTLLVDGAVPQMKDGSAGGPQQDANNRDTSIVDHSPLQSTSDGMSTSTLQQQQHQQQQTRRHTLLHLTHSITSAASSAGRQSLSGDALSDLEVLEYLDVPVDLPSTPKLKRYPSAKASRMWHPRS